MLIRLTFMLGWLAFVAACSEQIGTPGGDAGETPAAPPAPAPVVAPVFEQEDRPAVQPAASQIDWNAAREDMAAVSRPESAGGFQVQSGDLAPPVPVLLPSGIVRPESAGPPAFRELADGYFARYPGIAYSTTVSGTNEVFDTEAGGDSGNIDARFQATATGAIVSLRRYGASYMVEFECNGASGEDGDMCIDEAEALEVAEGLTVAGTR